MNPFDAGALVSPKIGLAPQSSSGATHNGPAIDRTASGNDGFVSALLTLVTGAVSGSPTSFSATAKLQDSADGTSWADIAGFSVPAISAANSISSVSGTLQAARRYLRVVVTTSFTGGTTPSVLVGATLDLLPKRLV